MITNANYREADESAVNTKVVDEATAWLEPVSSCASRVLLSGRMARGTAAAEGGETAALGTGMIGCKSELERRRWPRLFRDKLASWALDVELLNKRAGLLLLLALPLVLLRLARLDPITGWLVLNDVGTVWDITTVGLFPGVFAPEPLLERLRCFPCYK